MNTAQERPNLKQYKKPDENNTKRSARRASRNDPLKAPLMNYQTKHKMYNKKLDKGELKSMTKDATKIAALEMLAHAIPKREERIGN